VFILVRVEVSACVHAELGPANWQCPCQLAGVECHSPVANVVATEDLSLLSRQKGKALHGLGVPVTGFPWWVSA
jgi:hypothetical protein